MKNKKVLLILFSLVLVAFSVFVTSRMLVYADQTPSIIISYGESKTITQADCCVLNFGINISSEKYSDGKEKIEKIYANAKSKIQDLNSENSIYRTYSSCYPIRNGQLDGYNFCYNFSIHTKDLLKVEEITNTMHDCGIFNFYGYDFTLENKDDIYANALKEATEDATKKALVLNANSKIKAIIETNIYSYSDTGNLGQIIVEAKIKALYVETIDTLNPTV